MSVIKTNKTDDTQIGVISVDDVTNTKINSLRDELSSDIKSIKSELDRSINASWNDMLYKLDRTRRKLYNMIVFNLVLVLINICFSIYITMR